MLYRFVALFSGLLFGFGMMISGMVNPAKVIGFLDLFGAWDPSLAFVMGGALAVFVPGYLLLCKQEKPVLAEAFCVAQTQAIDKKLISGSVLFGIGWGLAGICPGPAVTSLGAGSGTIALFFLSMIAGMFVVNVFTGRREKLAYATSN